MRDSAQTGIIYPITPMGAPRMTKRDVWKKRPVVLRYHAFKDEVRLHKVFLPQPCKVVFYMPIPESWSRKKKAAMCDQPHTQKFDLDNLLKALMDSVFEDDAHVWSVWAEKRWANYGAISVFSGGALS